MKEEALAYHQQGRPGKLEIRATKPLANQRDLALAYSPGVAEACLAIAADAAEAVKYTVRGNLVGVITNGSAVLGLGNIGALAAKPVMEGKAVLFKKFADIDVFDIEINEADPHALADTIRRLEPTFGAINLEDIKAPECFIVEERLKAEMNIPVFHDDQHGTAIVVAAAIVNAMRLLDKSLADMKLVSTGGGAAGIACLNLLLSLGLKRENVWLCDIDGLVYKGRAADTQKAAFAQATKARALSDVVAGADIFLGLSGAGVLKAEHVTQMARDPLILALANPVPEILPEEAWAVRPDAIVATGRTDYPNQVNNVLCFPFIFRGALDVGATQINHEMKIACVTALADLARSGAADEVARAYRGQKLRFGRDYLLPKPFDPRLLVAIAPAVAKAAMESGVARRPIADMAAYVTKLSRFVYRSSFVMKPVFEAARAAPRRIIFAEGENERVLRTVQMICDEKIASPEVTGRFDRIEAMCRDLGLGIVPGQDFKVFDPTDEIINLYGNAFHMLMAREGIDPERARRQIRANDTLAAAMHVKLGHADAMICGITGPYLGHLKKLVQVFDRAGNASCIAALMPLILDDRTVFITDGYVNFDPTAADIAAIARMAAAEVRRFGLTPRVALVCHANFGSDPSPSALKMRKATEILTQEGADFEFEGEMRFNLAFDRDVREKYLPSSRLTDSANILVLPGIDAANAAINALKSLARAQTIGPILMGMNATAHIATPSVTSRGLLNMAALASVGSGGHGHHTTAGPSPTLTHLPSRAS